MEKNIKENKKYYIKCSKLISLILRHKPETINVTLNKNGFLDVTSLLDGLKLKNFEISLSDLEYIVENDNKQRFLFSSDHKSIRANQGHSLEVDLELLPKVPPKTLYHGTADRFLDAIMLTGIQKMNRQYVHLSSDINTATLVVSRHGVPIILKIDTLSMLKDGYCFYLSENNVWLTSNISPKYIEIQTIKI